MLFIRMLAWSVRLSSTSVSETHIIPDQQNDRDSVVLALQHSICECEFESV